MSGPPQIDPHVSAKYGFDTVFPSDSAQADVYSKIGPAIVIRATRLGIHSTFMAYGQTGSGKTHTTVGGAGEARGIIPRIVEVQF